MDEMAQLQPLQFNWFIHVMVLNECIVLDAKRKLKASPRTNVIRHCSPDTTQLKSWLVQFFQDSIQTWQECVVLIETKQTINTSFYKSKSTFVLKNQLITEKHTASIYHIKFKTRHFFNLKYFSCITNTTETIAPSRYHMKARWSELQQETEQTTDIILVKTHYF